MLAAGTEGLRQLATSWYFRLLNVPGISGWRNCPIAARSNNINSPVKAGSEQQGRSKVSMKTMPFVSRTARLALVSVLFAAAAAQAGEIRVMNSGAFTSAYLELKSQLERVP